MSGSSELRLLDFVTFMLTWVKIWSLTVIVALEV